MQVVILCGGFGTRIRDVAEDIPKPMIPIGGRPILWHIMKGYARHGFTDFVLCLGHKGWIIKRHFLDYHLAHSDFTMRLTSPEKAEIHGEGYAENWRITFAETGLDVMTGCRIKRIEKYLRGDTFLATYGDGVSDIDLKQLVAFHKAHGRVGTVTTVQPPGRFGELDLDGDQVNEFTEKPLVAPGWISGGFFVFNRKIFDRLEDDPTLVLERQPLMTLARDRELMAYKHTGFWHPMDSSRDYKYLNDLHDSRQAPWLTWEAPTAFKPASAA
ncbi:MAG: glucose-1-phosphate cytidylyltransferase [Planctomycetes bacterium]|nr:glucose-1-phosphate cytidylyltransferase [Planctomycetota bacterium]